MSTHTHTPAQPLPATPSGPTPPAVAWLGYGGLLPFLALAATGLWAPGTPWWSAALLAYGAVILSFVGALHWGFAMAQSGLSASERVYDLFGAALECNRDEWAPRMRCMGSCPCKQPGRPIARFHSNPSGKRLAGRSAALRRLWIAELSTAHRALQPIPARYLRGPEKIVNTFSERTRCFVWSVVPSLMAWPATLLPPAAGSVLLIAGFAAHLVQDHRLAARTSLPAWYLPLRWRLTATACVCLAVGAWAASR